MLQKHLLQSTGIQNPVGPGFQLLLISIVQAAQSFSTQGTEAAAELTNQHRQLEGPVLGFICSKRVTQAFSLIFVRYSVVASRTGFLRNRYHLHANIRAV